MRNPLLAPELRELLVEGRTQDLIELLSDLHPNDAASILSGLEPEEITKITSLLPLQLERSIFEYLDAEMQEAIIAGSGRERVLALVAAMSSDERAAFIDRLDERVRDQVFPLLNKAIREDLVRREQFEPNQVGAILSTEYCALAADWSIVKAIEEVRRQAPSKETIYYSYVVDGEGRLLGLVSLRDLMIARAHQTIGEIMRTDIVRVDVRTDRAEAVKLIREYDLIAIPVVDLEGKLVGIVTYDDAADIQEAENTQDIERQAGITGGGTSYDYADQSVASHFRRRVPWVAALATMFFVTASMIQHFQGLLQSSLLIAFLPMVMSTGGNVGAQASTVVVRGLALGKLAPAMLGRIVWKELRISLCLGLVLCGVAFAEVSFLGSLHGVDSVWRTCGAVSAALMLQIVTAAMLGALIPIGVSAMRLDPALVANPALTTLADLCGAMLYFLTIRLLL
jgi:magnesium transporter